MATIDRQNLLSKQRLETTFKMFDKVRGVGLIRQGRERVAEHRRAERDLRGRREAAGRRVEGDPAGGGQELGRAGKIGLTLYRVDLLPRVQGNDDEDSDVISHQSNYKIITLCANSSSAPHCSPLSYPILSLLLGYTTTSHSQPYKDLQGLHRGFTNSFSAISTVARSVYEYQYELAREEYNSEQYHRKRKQIHQRVAERILKLSQTNRGVYLKAGQYIGNLERVMPK